MSKNTISDARTIFFSFMIATFGITFPLLIKKSLDDYNREMEYKIDSLKRSYQENADTTHVIPSPQSSNHSLSPY